MRNFDIGELIVQNFLDNFLLCKSSSVAVFHWHWKAYQTAFCFHTEQERKEKGARCRDIKEGSRVTQGADFKAGSNE